ncbi:hypothetical protein VIGAN_08100000 [Vigna angularis var. angularis]|uniref:Uncharacterized protein n=1 Tax=Vigna angularis var. angularis TaxID=157739 RepID=A0A0S3SNJ1_PHAAN|nr:hypothetical protein VIGAN_08100000 [Vigna angularis var. angularis]
MDGWPKMRNCICRVQCRFDSIRLSVFVSKSSSSISSKKSAYQTINAYSICFYVSFTLILFTSISKTSPSPIAYRFSLSTFSQ